MEINNLEKEIEKIRIKNENKAIIFFRIMNVPPWFSEFHQSSIH